MELNVADAFVIALLLFSTVLAIYRGFIREALTVVTWLIAGWLAVKLGKSSGQIFVIVASETIKEIMGMVTVFFTVVLVGMVLKFLVCRAFSIGGPTKLDRFAGSLFGIARGLVIVFAILWLAPSSTLKQPWYTGSYLLPKINILADMVAAKIPTQWKEFKVQNAGSDKPRKH